MTCTTLYLDEIRIGLRRRQDLGDLRGLAASIAELGLLHPVVVRPDGLLVAGRRRMEAWRLACGPDVPIPVHVVDIAAIAAGEFGENVERKDLTPSESVALMRDLTPTIAAESRERQHELGRQHGVPAQGCGQSPTRGRTRDLVGMAVGRSARWLAKAAQVSDAAVAEPERFGRLAVAMDRTGRVDGPFRRLHVMRQAEQIRREPPPLPSRGPYRVLVADPPWPFDADSEDQSERATHAYPLMTLDQIRAFPVQALTHDDAVLWLWTTNHHLPRAFSVLEAWGFTYRTTLTWFKHRFGQGHYLRGKTEHCLLGTRGRPVFEGGSESTELRAPARNNSEKPDAFYRLVERLCPAPLYVDLFAHGRAMAGWDSFCTQARPDSPASAEVEA